jgi:predicted transposase YdaD
VGGRRPHLIHIEMHSGSPTTLPRRLWRYNALLDLKYDRRVRSVAVLLRPESDSKMLTGVLDLRLPDGDRIVEFHYKIVRVWEQPVEPILAGRLATLPMAPLADVPLLDLPRVLERIDSRLIAETSSSDAATMMSRTLALAGLRLDQDQINACRRRLRTMNILKESSFYQLILREGLEEGRKEGQKEGRKEGQKEGRREGQIEEAQKLLIRLGRLRLGRLAKATRIRIESIDDLERLEQLSERLLIASSWDELLAES